MTRGNLYDLIGFWATRLNSSSQGTGQLDPDSVGVGPTVSPAFLLKGPMTLKTAKGSRSTVEWRGGGRPEGKTQAGLDSIGDAELQLSQWDTSLDPFMMGGLLDTTSLVNAEISAPNNINPTPNTVACCGIVKINLQGSVKGVKYVHFFYPRATMSRETPDAQQVDGNQKNPSPITIKITPSVTDHFWNGIAFGANQGYYTNSEFELALTYPYPYFFDTWIADGTATTFTTTYLPKKSTVALGKTDNWFTKNGALVVPTSISTTTGVVTLASAGSASDIINLMYPIDASLLI